jgi:ribonuclease-3
VTYDKIDESGPAHDKNFTFQVSFNGIILGTGTGPSKKKAEQAAAKVALEKKVTK